MSIIDVGGVFAMFNIDSTFSVSSSELSIPNPHAILWCDPNKLVTTGWLNPFTFSNSSAGPLDLIVLSVIAEISNSVDTSAVILRRSPFVVSFWMTLFFW